MWEGAPTGDALLDALTGSPPRRSTLGARLLGELLASPGESQRPAAGGGAAVTAGPGGEVARAGPRTPQHADLCQPPGLPAAEGPRLDAAAGGGAAVTAGPGGRGARAGPGTPWHTDLCQQRAPPDAGGPQLAAGAEGGAAVRLGPGGQRARAGRLAPQRADLCQQPGLPAAAAAESARQAARGGAAATAGPGGQGARAGQGAPLRADLCQQPGQPAESPRPAAAAAEGPFIEARPRSRSRGRAAARWEAGWDASRMVLLASLDAWPLALAAWQGATSISAEEVLERARWVVEREARVGGRAYIGSTSDPAWRYRGGRYLVEDPSGPPGASMTRCMEGHRHKWQHMEVLGCWPDAECASMEKQCIESVMQSHPCRLTNKAAGAFGLAIRRYEYSFVYICFGQQRGYPPPLPSAASTSFRLPVKGPSTLIAPRSSPQLDPPRRTTRRARERGVAGAGPSQTKIDWIRPRPKTIKQHLRLHISQC